MIIHNVYIETGKKRTFACVLDWPGWCRSGRDETTAMTALIAYASRYASVLQDTNIPFQVPHKITSLVVTERFEGNATTDFGAPAIIPDSDRGPVEEEEYRRLRILLGACWNAFDSTITNARGAELRKGPRGGGRELERILRHVLESGQGYLARLAWKFEHKQGMNSLEAFSETRQTVLQALDGAMSGDLPEQGPRGGAIWPLRYFVRRLAWHILDHAWEIEDRKS